MSLEAVYARVPKIKCQRKCAASCGVIDMSRQEHFAVQRQCGGSIPTPTSLDCPMLRDGECSVYEARPLICRLWGVVEAMRCPHGCEPERVLTHEEAYALLAEAAALSHYDLRRTHSLLQIERFMAATPTAGGAA